MSEVFGYHANLQRGILLREHGRFQEASAHFGYAIEAQPDNSRTYFEQAICYANWGKTREALRYLDRGRTLAPNDPDFLILRAWILSGHPMFSWRALGLVNKALEMDPTRTMAFVTKARIYRVGRYWKQSEVAAREALSLDPLNDYAANLLAVALREQGRTGESRFVIQQILQRVPNDAFGHANAGWTALQTGEHERAYRHFMEALRIDPTESLACAGLPHAIIQRAWTYRLYYRAVAFYLRQPFVLKASILLVIFFSPVALIPFISTSLSGPSAAIGMNIVMTLMALVIFFFSTQSLGRLAVPSSPADGTGAKFRDLYNGFFALTRTGAMLFIFVLVGAWFAALVFIALAVSLFCSIRRPSAST